MNIWTIVIYGVAGTLALQGLFSLMVAYRQQALQQIFEEEIRRREAELAAADAKVEPQASPANPKRKAA